MDQNRQVLTLITAGCGGSAAARVFPKKLGRRVSERTASTARSELSKKKIFFDCRSSRKFFNMNNCHAKDFQHKNFPIYGTPHIGWYILYIPPLIGEFLGVYSEGHRPEWYRCFNNWREVISSNFWQHYSLSLACLAAPTGGKVMHVYCVLQDVMHWEGRVSTSSEPHDW